MDHTHAPERSDAPGEQQQRQGAPGDDDLRAALAETWPALAFGGSMLLLLLAAAGWLLATYL